MDQTLIQRLVRAAGAKREMSAEEFARQVPLESMTLEQTAQLISDLESAGVTVEVDPRLTHPNKEYGARTVPADTIVLSRKETWPRADAHALARPQTSPDQSRPSTTIAWQGVVAAFFVLCMIAAALLWFFAR